MKDVSSFSKIFLATKPVDFRKQAHGLSLIVEHTLKLPATSEKYLFAFTNRRRTSLKLLYWDSSGYALWWKVLEKEKFRWPRSQEEAQRIQPRELKWLLEGIDLATLKRHNRLEI